MSPMTPHDIQRMIDGLARESASASLHGRDFFLTWDKSREELEAIFDIATHPEGAARQQHLPPRCGIRASPSPSSATIPPAPGSASPRHAISWGSRWRTWTKASRRSRTVRRCGKRRT